MRVTYVGIDPGKEGGVASIYPDGAVRVSKLPGDDRGLLGLFSEMFPAGGGPYECSVEEQWARPTTYFDRQSNSFKSTILKSTCELYGSYRSVMALLTFLGHVSFSPVKPQAWQKALGMFRKKNEADTAWKNRLKSRAADLHPLPFSSGRLTLATSDALLLAHYCSLRKKVTVL